MILGLSHLTLSVSSLARSYDFYVNVLCCRPLARWPEGAYLAAGDVWLALVVDKNARRGPLAEYSHIAFQVSAETYEKFVARVLDAGARVFQENKTEGASLYFLDPDGHKLEVHVGDLQSRLESARRHPWNGLELFD